MPKRFERTERLIALTIAGLLAGPAVATGDGTEVLAIEQAAHGAYVAPSTATI
jgi:hypothetical protein